MSKGAERIKMDKYEIQHAERTFRHIRRVQDHMLYLIAHHSEKFELSKKDQFQLLYNATQHDQSKWQPRQFGPYCDKFVKKIEAPDFGDAWENHYQKENHHYQSGRWIGKLELIEICCDLQAMADEFKEGSCRGFWGRTWWPDFHKWLNSPASEGTDVRRQMADDYQWHALLIGRMEDVISALECQSYLSHASPRATPQNGG